MYFPDSAFSVHACLVLSTDSAASVAQLLSLRILLGEFCKSDAVILEVQEPARLLV